MNVDNKVRFIFISPSLLLIFGSNEIKFDLILKATVPTKRCLKTLKV